MVKAVKPDSHRVRELLTPHLLGQTQLGDTEGSQLPSVTLGTLRHRVAASHEQLDSILADGPYVELNGAWQFLTSAAERELLDICLSIVTANGWDPNAVEATPLLEKLTEEQMGGGVAIPSTRILRKVLRSVLADPAKAAVASEGAAATESKDGATATAADSSEGVSAASGGDDVIKLDPQKIKRFHAMQVLRAPPDQVRRRFELPPPERRTKRPRLSLGGGGAGGGSALQVQEFVAALQELSGSETTKADAEALLGDAAYIDELDGTVHTLDINTLPQNPKERLKRLFEILSHWRPEKLATLISPVLPVGQKVDVWLMKFARAVFIDLEAGKGEERMLIKKFQGL